MRFNSHPCKMGPAKALPSPTGCRGERMNRQETRKPSFSFAARALVRLACRMAGQPSHMPHGGNPNSLCHTPGPAHPPDPQVSPLPLSAGPGSLPGTQTSLRLLRPGQRRQPRDRASSCTFPGTGAELTAWPGQPFVSLSGTRRSLSVLGSGWGARRWACPWGSPVNGTALSQRVRCC